MRQQGLPLLSWNFSRWRANIYIYTRKVYVRLVP